MREATSKRVKEELLDLIIAVDKNANAYDDDKEETWEHLKQSWDTVQKLVNRYVQEQEGREYRVLIEKRNGKSLTKSGFKSEEEASNYANSIKDVSSYYVRRV